MAKQEAETPIETPPLSVFVTGASTGAGLAVVRQLAAAGYRVTGATTEGTTGADDIRKAGALPVHVDLLRPMSIRGALLMCHADVVVHMEPQRLNGTPQHRVDWNAALPLLRDGSSVLVEACGKTEVKRIIYPSFAFLYGDHHGEWVDEEAALDTSQPFFAAAAAAEEAVIDGGIPGYVLRAGFIYGGEVEAMRAVYEGLRGGKSVVPGKGFANWIHVNDLAAVVTLLVDRDESDEPTADIFNIVDDSPTTPDAFADHLAAMMGLGTANKTNTMLTEFFGDTLQNTLLAQSVKVKNDKAKEKLGWSPKYSDQTAGLEQTLLVWRAESVPEAEPETPPETETSRAYALLAARAEEEQKERA